MLKSFYYKIIKLNKFHAAMSLLEIMITVAIIATLMTISFNSISTLDVDSKRKEAINELLKTKSIIEQFAISGYVGNIKVNNTIDVAANLRDQQFPDLKNYTISISTDNSTNYKLTATAKQPLSTQDTDCKEISLKVSTNNQETRQPEKCWKNINEKS